VDSWRRRISQKVEDIQGLIESSKFESGDLQVDAIQKCTGDGQLIFVLLLSLARQFRDIAQSKVVMTAPVEVDRTIAAVLEALAMGAGSGSEPAVLQLDNALKAFEQSITGTDALDAETATHFRARLALYRALVAAIKRLCLEALEMERREQRMLASNGEMSFERRETQVN
jgi:hypothetical protein